MAWPTFKVDVTQNSNQITVYGAVPASEIPEGFEIIVGGVSNLQVGYGTAIMYDAGNNPYSHLFLVLPYTGSSSERVEMMVKPTGSQFNDVVDIFKNGSNQLNSTLENYRQFVEGDKEIEFQPLDENADPIKIKPLQKLNSDVQEMISEANSNLDSLFASIPQKDALEAASGGKNTILYDDQGNPNVMVWINKFNCEDVAAAILEKHRVDLNIGTGVHPAFIKDGVELRGFWYGKYQASPGINSGCSVIGGVQPYTSINYDQSKSKCTAKGGGWHLSTMHEWAAVSLLSAAYGAPVRGNTNYGRAHDATYETCRRSDNLAPGDSAGTGRADCGTGPATWSHDGTMFGVFDMTGNVWEWQDLFKLTDGNIITTPDNNPDLLEENWTATTAFFDGDSGAGHLNDSRTSIGATSTGNSAGIVQDATYTKIELLRQMLIEVDATLLNGRFYINNDGERLPVRGGDWSYGSNAGLAALSLYNARTNANGNIGFRPAFFE